MDKMRNFKNSILEFYKEEKWMRRLLLFGTSYIIFFIFTSEKKELLNYFAEVAVLFYDLSIAICIGVIFYFLQVFYPRRNIRLVANRDINFLINLRLHGLFYGIFEHYASDKLCSANSSKQNIYNEEYAKIITDNLKIDDVIKWSWNKNKKTWLDKINEEVKKFDMEYEKILIKYSSVIPWEIFNNFEHINRNGIFYSSRKGSLSQSSISPIVIKKLFVCMERLRCLSKELSSLPKQKVNFNKCKN